VPRPALALALVLLAAGAAGCLGSQESGSAIDETAANATNASGEDTDQRTVESRSVENGTGGAGNATPETEPDNDTDPEPLAFREPLPLNTEGYGFEPSIDVGPDGTLYATAARSTSTDPADQLASWLWYSTDEGRTWSQVASPLDAHEKQPAFEGDVAVDDEGRLYFVDTYLADNTLSRWSAGSEGPSWDFTRPLQGSAGVDDRPWLSAHGDGIVYYLGNNGPGVPAPNNLQGEDAPEDPSRMWLSVSEDEGRTFTLAHGFANSFWCGMDASSADGRSLAVVCSRMLGPYNGLEEGYESVVYVSGDRGRSWNETVLGEYGDEPTRGLPSAAFDASGTPYAVWGEGGGPTELFFARPGTDGWETFTVTPFEGTVEKPWLAGGSEGTVALAFYATNDTSPGEGSSWHAYAMVTDDARSAQPTWQLARLSSEPVARGGAAPGHFLQTEIGPDDVANVVFDRDTESVDQVLFARQTAGPNVDA
jgi:hypothetical protein